LGDVLEARLGVEEGGPLGTSLGVLLGDVRLVGVEEGDPLGTPLGALLGAGQMK
jgi:hypothetical protein